MQIRVLRCLLKTFIGEFLIGKLLNQVTGTMLGSIELLDSYFVLCMIDLLSFLEDWLGHGVFARVLRCLTLDSRRVQRLAVQVLLLHLNLRQGVTVDILYCVTILDGVQISD